jgi:hypothetical protein
MARPRIPDPDSIVWCVTCRRPVNGKGWYGPGCMGHEAARERPVRPGEHWA